MYFNPINPKLLPAKIDAFYGSLFNLNAENPRQKGTEGQRLLNRNEDGTLPRDRYEKVI